MKTVLVTGVSTGIGKNIAEYLLGKGCRVFGSVRKEEDAQALKMKWGEAFTTLVFDVCDPDAVHRAAEEVRSLLGKAALDTLVNNAGIATQGAIESIEMDKFIRQFDVNVFGLLRVTKAFLPLLRKSGSGSAGAGRIINISSVSSITPMPFVGAYAASKRALESLNDSMRREFFIYGIKVVSILPALIDTPVWDKAKADNLGLEDTPFASLQKFKDRIIEGTKKQAISPERVSKKVWDIMQKKKPRARYIVAKSIFRYFLAAWLPARWLDRMVTRNLKRALEKEGAVPASVKGLR